MKVTSKKINRILALVICDKPTNGSVTFLQTHQIQIFAVSYLSEAFFSFTFSCFIPSRVQCVKLKFLWSPDVSMVTGLVMRYTDVC